MKWNRTSIFCGVNDAPFPAFCIKVAVLFSRNEKLRVVDFYYASPGKETDQKYDRGNWLASQRIE